MSPHWAGPRPVATPQLLDFSTSCRINLVESLRKLEVLLRDSPLAVRGEVDAYLVVVDGDVRMMVGLLGCFSDFVHKCYGGHKRFESELPVNFVARKRPFRQALQFLLDLCFAQCCHSCSFCGP
ncbi:hypothetical protein SBA2_70016 [Acidobacteriia bacterium SbA2]|nr:hypothetical protein SBA2_70016 [Acidobacteriia bacterium SbA2]